MNARYAWMTDVGRIRGKNEDNYYVPGTVAEKRPAHSEVSKQDTNLTEPALFGIFDGMGGYASGEVASEIAAKEAEVFAERISDYDPEQLLTEICSVSNEKVCDEIRSSGTTIGTTASMVCLRGNQCTLCNVGDSPVFLFRDGQLTQVSKDHTERETYEKITGKKADRNRKFSLTQNIGILPEEMLIEPYLTSFSVKKNDYLLLCSDGLTDMVSPGEISRIISAEKEPGRIVSQCVSAALTNGGKDNVTVICISFINEKRTDRIRNIFLFSALAVIAAAAIVLLLCVIGRCSAKNGAERTPAKETTASAAQLLDADATENATDSVGSETNETAAAENTGSATNENANGT